MASDDEEAMIARLSDTFAENIKSRTEAARTRRKIAVKLNSHLSYYGAGENIPSSVAPPGKKITGIRRRYLEALNTNIEARERYQLANLGTEHQQDLQPQGLLPHLDAVLSHLELSRLEKRHQELEIRRRHVSTLSQDALDLCNLNIAPSEQEIDVIGAEGIASSVAEVEALISKLRKALLQANHQLEREKVLLAGVKQTQARLSSGHDRPADRPKSIAETRDALVAWLDEKLSTSGANQAEEVDGLNGVANGEDSQARSSTKEHYQMYLFARKEVVGFGNEAVQTLPRRLPAGPDIAVPAPNEHPPISNNLSLVHAVRQHLVPLLQQQSASMTLKQYLSAQSAKERQDTLEVLERLADESYLLSTYPAGDVDSMDALGRNVVAWVSAADASSAAAEKAIDEQHKEGLQALENSENEVALSKPYQDNHENLRTKKEGINWNGIHGKLESIKFSVTTSVTRPPSLSDPNSVGIKHYCFLFDA